MTDHTKTLLKYGALTAGLAVASPFAPLLVKLVGLGALPRFLEECIGQQTFQKLESVGYALHRRLEAMEAGVVGNEAVQKLQEFKADPANRGINHDLRRGIVLALANAVGEFQAHHEFSPRWREELSRLEQRGAKEHTEAQVYVAGLLKEFTRALDKAANNLDELNRLFPDTLRAGRTFSEAEADLRRLAAYCQVERDDVDPAWNAVYDCVLLGTGKPGLTQPITHSFDQLIQLRGLNLRRELTDFLQHEFPTQFVQIVKQPKHRPTWIAYQKLFLETTRDQVTALSMGIDNLAAAQRDAFADLARRLDRVAASPAALECFADSVTSILAAIQEGTDCLIQVVRTHAEAIRGSLDELLRRQTETHGQVIATHEDVREAREEIRRLELQYIEQRAVELIKERAHQEFRVDISLIVKYAPEALIGRDDELQILNEAWAQVCTGNPKRPRVLTFVALGGEGKTSLVAKWAGQLAAQDWPGCDLAFAWSFHSQGTRESHAAGAASSDVFLKEALTFFGDEAMASSGGGAFEKGRRLARLVGERRALLILDGLEPLQYAPSSPMPGELKDQGIAAVLRGLAAASHGLCVVTTRYSLPDLKTFRQTTAPEVKLLRLSLDAGVHLLQKLGVIGTPKEFEALVEDVKGHALTLNVLGSFLKRAFHGDIRQRDRVKFEKADEKFDGGHAFRVMAAYEQWLLRDGGDACRREVALLRLTGLFDRPADAGCLAALRRETIPGLTEPLADLDDEDWEYCLSGLEAAKLLTLNRDASGVLVSLDAHPLLREYFAQQLRVQQPDAWRSGHRRIYEHLCASTIDRSQPTLEDLLPLYQAVAHGCEAGLHAKSYSRIYRKRILKQNRGYSIHELGAFGCELDAVSCFFEKPWTKIVNCLTKEDQSWLLEQAGFCLHALGRLAEARDPIKASLDIDKGRMRWAGASTSAGHLSELHLTLGEIESALVYGKIAVELADRSCDSFLRRGRTSRMAYSLHQAGRNAEALRLFEAAESQLNQSVSSTLVSLHGFRYCELLLAHVEVAAWTRTINPDQTAVYPRGDFALVASRCLDVHDRAMNSLRAAASGDVATRLWIALDRLILSRSALLGGMLNPIELERTRAIEVASKEVAIAINCLRKAADLTEVPRGLLTRAWLRFLTGACTGPESAQADLDEAWEIAERGPMRLHMADIHLHRARLFFREKTYPWESPAADLSAAEKLIHHCGYHRRDEELTDAKRAILGT